MSFGLNPQQESMGDFVTVNDSSGDQALIIAG
jgi:hypothetical protein